MSALFSNFARIKQLFIVIWFFSTTLPIYSQFENNVYTETIEYSFDEELRTLKMETSFIDSTHFYWKNVPYIYASSDSSLTRELFEIVELDSPLSIYRTPKSWVILQKEYFQWLFTFLPRNQIDSILEIYPDGFLAKSGTQFDFYTLPLFERFTISSSEKPKLFRSYETWYTLYPYDSTGRFIAKTIHNDSLIYLIELDEIIELPRHYTTHGLVKQDGKKRIMNFTNGIILPFDIKNTFKTPEKREYELGPKSLIYIGDSMIIAEDIELGIYEFPVEHPQNLRLIEKNVAGEKQYISLLFDHSGGLGVLFHYYDFALNLALKRLNDSIVFLPTSYYYPYEEQLNLISLSVQNIPFKSVKLLPSKKVFLAETDYFFQQDSLSAKIFPKDWYIYSHFNQPLFCVNYLQKDIGNNQPLNDWLHVLDKPEVVILKNEEGKVGVFNLSAKILLPFEYDAILYNEKKEVFTVVKNQKRKRMRLSKLEDSSK